MLGIIDVGGGLRGIYGAGFLDYCMDREISFDYGIRQHMSTQVNTCQRIPAKCRLCMVKGMNMG